MIFCKSLLPPKLLPFRCQSASSITTKKVWNSKIFIDWWIFAKSFLFFLNLVNNKGTRIFPKIIVIWLDEIYLDLYIHRTDIFAGWDIYKCDKEGGFCRGLWYRHTIKISLNYHHQNRSFKKTTTNDRRKMT